MNENLNEFSRVVRARRSQRAFLSNAVPDNIIEAIFNEAARSPSNCNTQPWLVHIASGESIERLRKVMPEKFLAGEMSLDFPYDGNYQGVYQKRQYASANALYSALSISREDKVQRQQTFMRNFTFFDAPHVAFLFLPEPFGLREAADVGMFAQTLMLGMTVRGLGSCPQTALGMQADLVRQELGIDASNKLLFGLSFGYPDPEAKANCCETQRADFSDFVVHHR